jgi:hypothetical protein
MRPLHRALRSRRASIIIVNNLESPPHLHLKPSVLGTPWARRPPATTGRKPGRCTASRLRPPGWSATAADPLSTPTVAVRFGTGAETTGTSLRSKWSMAPVLIAATVRKAIWRVTAKESKSLDHGRLGKFWEPDSNSECEDGRGRHPCARCRSIPAANVREAADPAASDADQATREEHH